MVYSSHQQQLYDLVEQIEANLKELKQLIAQYSSTQTTKQHKSLYGIFPRTRTTLSDFREARQSWSRQVERA